MRADVKEERQKKQIDKTKEGHRKNGYTEVDAGYYTGAGVCPEERFPSVKVFYLASGDCEITFSDTVIRLKEKELIVFNEEDYSLKSKNRDSEGILLFIRLAREYAGEFGEVLQNKHLDYSSLLHYLDENYMEATLESTAAYFNFSPSYISRFLKKNTGESFMEHIHHRRMEAAAKILCHADVPAAKIASIVGYQNVSFFYRLFKKYYGCTPMEYRKRALREQGNH